LKLRANSRSRPPTTCWLSSRTGAGGAVARRLQPAQSDHELILVNDNDFGTKGVETQFFRVAFEEPVLR
jgi:hypothetical protein